MEDKLENKENLVRLTIEAYEKCSKEFINSHGDNSDIIKYLEYFLSKLKGDKVLDVGFGSARDSKYFIENNLDVTGIDLTSAFVKNASETIPAGKFFEMDMRNLEFEAEVFDGIWCCASFLHIPKLDAQKALEGFYRVLNHNGLLFIGVKEGQNEKLVKVNTFKNEERFFAFWEEHELSVMLKKIGFKIIKIFRNIGRDKWLNIFAVKETPYDPAGHTKIFVSNYQKSYDFYEKLFNTIGYKQVTNKEEHAAWVNKFGYAFIIAQAEKPQIEHIHGMPGVHHICLKVESEVLVDEVYTQLLTDKSFIYHAPRKYPEYTDKYYAVFFGDPDKIQIEVANY